MRVKSDVCPMCLETFKRNNRLVLKVRNTRLYFCSLECKIAFIVEQKRFERLGLKDGDK